jgi:hypothetical protein
VMVMNGTGDQGYLPLKYLVSPPAQAEQQLQKQELEGGYGSGAGGGGGGGYGGGASAEASSGLSRLPAGAGQQPYDTVAPGTRLAMAALGAAAAAAGRPSAVARNPSLGRVSGVRILCSDLFFGFFIHAPFFF